VGVGGGDSSRQHVSIVLHVTWSGMGWACADGRGGLKHDTMLGFQALPGLCVFVWGGGQEGGVDRGRQQQAVSHRVTTYGVVWGGMC
jgi:hypothetical protein